MKRDEVSIMVVDDVNTMRVQIRELLRGFGFPRVTVAASGEEAKKLLDQGEFHLLLVDWHMSPTDGIEFLKYVRGHSQHKGIAFIMVTAESTKEHVVEAIKTGVDDYVIKPLTPTQIQTKLYGVLLKKKVLS